MDLKKFLKAYMKAHGIQVFPKPTINNNSADLINKVNGTPPTDPPANHGNAVPQDQVEGVAAEGAAADDKRTQDDEMIEATENAKIVGGRAAITPHIFDTAMKCIFEPIQLFHKTCLENEEAKQIKAAIMLPRLSGTTQQVAQVIASERLAERPVLHGLIQETANKTTSDLEKCILLLESKLKAATLTPKQAKKTAAKNEKGNRTKSPPKSILWKKGIPAAQNHTPKKKKAAATAQDANNNVTMRISKKKQPKKHHVSFNGNKRGQNTNSCK
jgi:hypothetical protein